MPRPSDTRSSVIADDVPVLPKELPATAITPGSLEGNFAELSKRIKRAGLLNAENRYSAWKLVLNTFLFAIGIAAFIVIGRSWYQLFIAVYMGFCAGQCIFVWHDTGHQSMFRDQRKLATVLGHIHANLANGASYGWWVNHHNRHHSHPNHLELDPDIGRRTVIFDLKQYPSRRGYKKLIVRYQSVLFFVLLSVESLKMQRTAFQMIGRGQVRRPVMETTLIVVRAVIYLGLLFWILTPWQAICFFAVQTAVQGIYFGMLFAPNHKGMGTRDEAESMNWLERQVLTSRNIRPSWYMDFLTGGLNYQIEHHLFPTMSQKHLPECRRIVREFCAEHNIPYHEVGFWQSYKEVAQFLHVVSAPIRAGEVDTSGPAQQAA